MYSKIREETVTARMSKSIASFKFRDHKEYFLKFKVYPYSHLGEIRKLILKELG